MIELTKAEQEIYQETAKILKGSDRRVFMARVVKVLVQQMVSSPNN